MIEIFNSRFLVVDYSHSHHFISVLNGIFRKYFICNDGSLWFLLKWIFNANKHSFCITLFLFHIFLIRFLYRGQKLLILANTARYTLKKDYYYKTSLIELNKRKNSKISLVTYQSNDTSSLSLVYPTLKKKILARTSSRDLQAKETRDEIIGIKRQLIGSSHRVLKCCYVQSSPRKNVSMFKFVV